MASSFIQTHLCHRTNPYEIIDRLSEIHGMVLGFFGTTIDAWQDKFDVRHLDHFTDKVARFFQTHPADVCYAANRLAYKRISSQRLAPLPVWVPRLHVLLFNGQEKTGVVVFSTRDNPIGIRTDDGEFIRLDGSDS